MFQYDNRRRLTDETRTLDGDPDVTIYDLAKRDIAKRDRHQF